jgi:hypothetical protein
MSIIIEIELNLIIDIAFPICVEPLYSSKAEKHQTWSPWSSGRKDGSELVGSRLNPRLRPTSDPLNTSIHTFQKIDLGT